MFLRSLKFKYNIKKIGLFTKKYPIFHKFLYKSYNFYIIYISPIFYIYKKLKFNNRKLSTILGLQTIEKIETNLNLSSRKELSLSLKHLNLEYGGWCVYYKNAFEILDSKLFPNFYKKENIGLKILINDKKIKTQKKSAYGIRPFGKYGDVKELVRIGNRLNFLNLGPKIFDLIILKDINNIEVYAYMVEDINGKNLDKKDELLFKSFKNNLLQDNWLKPAFNTTLFIDDFLINKKSSNFKKNKKGEIKFIDFQSFSISNEKDYLDKLVSSFSETGFGRKRIFSNKNYLYQVLPVIQNGKRDTLKRWKVFDELYKNSKINLQDKIILDVGCNLGMNTYYALTKGSKFVYGIDKDLISQKARTLLLSLGSTRFKIFGLDLNSKNDLKKINLLIEEKIDILFYCSVAGHIGYPSEINNLNYKYILFEGHTDTTIEDNYKTLKSENWLKKDLCKILYKTYISDGDSGERPLLFIETGY